MRLFLVRHGETAWNSSRIFQGQKDTDLSELGVKQAECLAQRLAAERIDAAYASDLKRAYNTASIALRHHEIEIAPDARLREMAFGSFEGLNNAEIAARYPEDWRRWNEDWANVPPPGGGENLKDLAARVGGFFEEIRRRHPQETVLVVSHSGPMRALLCHVLHIDLAYFWQHRLDNATLNVIDVYEDRVVVSLLNDRCHLGDA